MGRTHTDVHRADVYLHSITTHSGPAPQRGLRFPGRSLTRQYYDCLGDPTLAGSTFPRKVSDLGVLRLFGAKPLQVCFTLEGLRPKSITAAWGPYPCEIYFSQEGLRPKSICSMYPKHVFIHDIIAHDNLFHTGHIFVCLYPVRSRQLVSVRKRKYLVLF